jgi:hypothetical protein
VTPRPNAAEQSTTRTTAPRATPVDGARIATARILASLVILGVSALLVGCATGKSLTPSSAELSLERAQLVEVSRELRALEAPVRHEVDASRAVWPAIADGLPATPSGALQRAVASTSATADALPEPRFMVHASTLTGPASGIAGLYESYSQLASRGWRLTAAGIAAIVRGTPTAARFARGNSSLYIDAIYDGHFNLSLLGKSLLSGYEKLGGAPVFSASLPRSEIATLAAAYSIPAVRLEPHPGPAVSEG